MLDDLASQLLTPELVFDGRDGTAVFRVDGEVVWSVVFGAGRGALAWFVVCHEPSGVEVHVADVARLAGEPVLEDLAAVLRRGADLV